VKKNNMFTKRNTQPGALEKRRVAELPSKSLGGKSKFINHRAHEEKREISGGMKALGREGKHTKVLFSEIQRQFCCESASSITNPPRR